MTGICCFEIKAVWFTCFAAVLDRERRRRPYEHVVVRDQRADPQTNLTANPDVMFLRDFVQMRKTCGVAITDTIGLLTEINNHGDRNTSCLAKALAERLSHG